MTISNFGLPPHGEDVSGMPQDTAAAPIDFVIAVFALGVILGSLIGGWA